ncbi:MAG TPA: PaaI family thioesterase [Dehalococcoidia bacterium]|nr:PaaI family thioesterase [Dehalococcoidia bacterium]
MTTPTRRAEIAQRLHEAADRLSDADLAIAADCVEALAQSAGVELLSNLGRLAGVRVAHSEPGASRLELPVRPAVMNPVGRLFGGASFALADIGMVQAHRLTHEPGDRSTTLEMKINYLEAVDSGTLIAESRIIHDADPIVTLASDIRDAAGRLVATAQGTRYISRAAKRQSRVAS